MVIYAYILIGMQALGLIMSLAAGKAQQGLTALFQTAVWLPVAGRIIGWW